MFKNRYRVNLSLWLQENYPTPKTTYIERKEKRTEEFVAEYLKLMPLSGDDFDRRRRKGVISWRGLALYYNITSWRKLLTILDLPLPRPKERERQRFDIKVYTDLDFEAMIEPKWRYY